MYPIPIFNTMYVGTKNDMHYCLMFILKLTYGIRLSLFSCSIIPHLILLHFFPLNIRNQDLYVLIKGVLINFKYFKTPIK